MDHLFHSLFCYGTVSAASDRQKHAINHAKAWLRLHRASELGRLPGTDRANAELKQEQERLRLPQRFPVEQIAAVDFGGRPATRNDIPKVSILHSGSGQREAGVSESLPDGQDIPE